MKDHDRITKQIAPVPPSRRTVWANRLAFAGLAVLSAVVAVLLFWAYQSDNVLTIKNAPFPTRIIQQDGERLVLMDIDYCKNLSVDGKVRISFVSKASEVLLPLSDDKQPAQCLKTSLPVLIPKQLPDDIYHVHFRTTYKINPLKTVTQEFDSVPFKVGG
jgi:hypothetical protein